MMNEAHDQTTVIRVAEPTHVDDRENRRLLRLILFDALASETMGTLTTGVFLVGFAVALGADNFAIGVLAAVPFFAQLLQIPAVLLVERWRVRRDICVFSTAIGRAFLVAAAAAPLLGIALSVKVLIASLAIYQGMAAIAGCAWNSWMRDLVPSSEYGRFFGRRTAATTALSMVAALGGGAIIDLWKGYMPEYSVFGYSLLFLVSAVVGYIGVYLLRITPDEPMAPAERAGPALALLFAPLREENFKRLIHFLASWNFAANLAAPFFAVYMLKSLDYSMITILVLTTLSQVSNIAALRLWGTLIDRFSNKAVLGVAAPLFLACTLAWTFTGVPWVKPYTFYLLAVIHILMGVATAGVGLASGNIAMKLSPPGQATAYLAANSVISAAAAAAAPILGGRFADFFALHQLTLAFTWTGGPQKVTVQVLNLHSWTFFFAMACVLGLYSLHRLSLVEEPSGVTKRLLLRDLLLEARRSVHSLSSAAGLTRVVRFPQWLFDGSD
jgi:MFS family permease